MYPQAGVLNDRREKTVSPGIGVLNPSPLWYLSCRKDAGEVGLSSLGYIPWSTFPRYRELSDA